MPRWLPAALFTLTTVAFLFLPLVGARTYAAVDALEQGAPYRNAIARPPHVVSPIQTDQTEQLPEIIQFFRDLRSGHWQQWSPRAGVGVPTGILPFNALLSPFSIPFLLLPAWYAAGLKVALTLLFCQAFTYLFLRRIGAGSTAATLGAVAYAFAGVNIVFLDRLTAPLVLPALLWAVTRAVDRPTVGRGICVAIFTAWTWFEGFPSGFVYCIYVAVAWGAWLVIRDRTTLRRRVVALAQLGASFGTGFALAAINLVPFIAELARSSALDQRQYGAAAHLPNVQLFGIFDLTSIGTYPKGRFWTGANPVESVTNIGLITTAAVVIALVAVASGRVKPSGRGSDAWVFFGVVAGLTVLLVFRGGPLLGIAYRIPGIAHNPIQRLRFLIPLGAVVVASLGATSLWQGTRSPGGWTLERMVALGLLAFGVMAVAVVAPDYLRGVRRAHEVGTVGRGLIEGSGAAALALAAAWAARRPGLLVAATAVIAALLYWQLAWPLRDFIPAAPVRDFYTAQRGHVALENLSAGRFRFLATERSNFYLNSSLVFPLYDVRSGGGVLRTPEQQRMMATALPGAFDTDPFKTVVSRDRLNVTTPLLDDLAVRYVAIGTDQLPFGTVRQRDADSTQWVDVGTDRGTETVAGGPVTAVAVQLRGTGNCEQGSVSVTLGTRAGPTRSSARPLYDVGNGGWLLFAIDGLALRAGDPYTLGIAMKGGRGCHLEAGVAAAPGGSRLSRWEFAPDPAAPVRLVSTEQAWIYERPTAWPLVSAHTRWAAFPNQAGALAFVNARQSSDGDVAAYVGADRAGGGGGPAPAISAVHFGDETVRFRSDGSERALLVVSQNGGDGWQARVDGRSVPSVAVDGALVGIFVEPGHHAISLTYRPWHARAGAAVSAVAALACVAAGGASAYRRRRANGADGSVAAVM
ncbi:MAG: YfhO family protein [Acidimicrobiia bacterium]|nr:YfhO family protein [Acidimicrobiia bacterium]